MAIPGDSNLVQYWFGEAFSELHPQLQELHLHGGRLQGDVDLDFGKGLAAVIGHRLAKRLGMPLQAGRHVLQVDIQHKDNALYWSRCFDQQHTVTSIFKPLGNYPSGFWLEKTGPVVLKLTVDILDHDWHWRVLRASIWGLPLPMILFPTSRAYKKIVDDQYEFHVSFSMPRLGTLLCYQGRLTMAPSNAGDIK